MASPVSTEILISLGDLPSPAGTQVSIDLGTGSQYVLTHKNKIRSTTGEDPADLKAYLTIPTASDQAAGKLAELLKKALNDAVTNSESFLGFAYSRLKPDPDEPALLDFDIKTYLANVVIVVSTTQYEEQAGAMLAMAVETAPDAFNTTNSLHIEVDTGRNAGEILSPQLSQMLTESGLFKIVFSHDPNVLLHAREALTNLGVEKKILRALAYASLYSGASLNLKFKSGTNLPESVLNVLNTVSSMIPALDKVLPPDALTLAHGIIEHAGHEVFINIVAHNIAFEVHLSIKGASQIFQFN